MDQIIEFAGNHVFLVAAFLAILSLLIWNLVTDPGSKGTVDPLGATEQINHQNAVVVDVRPAADFNQGHIINAINIPMSSFKEQLQTLNKYKDRPLILVCRSGNQSGMASKILRKEGFEKAYNLRGGMMAWQNANLPVSRSK